MPIRFAPIVFSLVAIFVTGGVCAEEPVSFREQIAPILKSKCVACHGQKLAESDYRVDTFARLMASGIDAGKPDDSDFLQRLTTDDEDIRMPAEADALPKSQIELVRRWIQQGAKFDGPSPDTPLSQLIPFAKHPNPPDTYPAAIPISAIASDGKEIYVSGYHEITVWSPSGELLRRITNQGQRTYSIDLHPTEPWLLSASGTPGELGEVRLFDRDSGELLKGVLKASEVIMDARFSPDGKLIAVGMPDGSTRILKTDSFEETQSLLGHSDAVTAVAWHKDGVRLATASRDASAKVFDTAKGRSIATFTGHTECVNAVVFIDDHQLISVSSDGTAQRWKLDSGRREQIVLDQKHKSILSVSANEKQYVLSGAIATHYYEVGSNRLLHRGDEPSDWVTASVVHRTADEPSVFIVGTQTGSILFGASDENKSQTEFVAMPR